MAAAHYWPPLWLVLQLEMGEHIKDVWYWRDAGATSITLAVHDMGHWMGHGLQSVLIHAIT